MASPSKLSPQSWTRFIGRLILGIVVAMMVVTLLTLALGHVFASKDQLVIPTRTPRHDNQMIAFLDIDRGITYFLDSHQKMVKTLFWSPDGNQIAFEAEAKADNEIYVMNATGGQIRQLTYDGVVSDSVLAWSPEGQQIIFVPRYGDGLNRIDVEKGIVSPLMNKFNGVQWPIWSPDGSQIAFLVFNTFASLSLNIVSRDGKNVRYIASDLNYYIGSLSWSPDGKFIAFDQFSGDSINIFTLNIATGDLRQLTDSSFTKGSPIWSLDGSHILYWEAKGNRIVSMNADGSDPTPVTYFSTATFTGLALSSDNQHIAFGVTDSRSGKISLYVMNADGSALRHLLDTNDDNSFVPVWHP